MSVLNKVHDVHPAFETDHLKTRTSQQQKFMLLLQQQFFFFQSYAIYNKKNNKFIFPLKYYVFSLKD